MGKLSRVESPSAGGAERAEFELACVREFSHSGLQLGPGVSRVERRERIRTAILRENKSHLPWRDTGMTYAEAYRHAYHEPLGEYLMPSKPKKSDQFPAQSSVQDQNFEQDDGEDEKDEFAGQEDYGGLPPDEGRAHFH